MSDIVRVGVDLAKNVLHVHAVDAAGKVIATRALPRGKFAEWCTQLPANCLVAMEACSGAHYWARQFSSLGHTVKLMAPKFVKMHRKSENPRPGSCRRCRYR